MTYAEWISEVDRKLIELCGLDHSSLPDYTWHDCYDDELEPEEAIAFAAFDQWEDMPYVNDVFGELIEKYV